MVELVRPVTDHSLPPWGSPEPSPASQSFAEVGDFWSPASLWIPDWIVASGWHQHAPFAFWLIETLRPRMFVELGTYTGFSYLTFCQAVQALGLGTTSYAVDTWTGDEHSGIYGEELFSPFFRSYHDSRYSGFSQLVRSTFAEALKYFDDRTIDLLHIDGRHFYDDVRRDFETWQPKLSPRAIVLVHDTTVREKGFGVWRFWKELSGGYPTFEFKHGHGLGVVAAGEEIPPALKPLFSASQAAGERIRQLYARLGAMISDRAEFKARDRELAAARPEPQRRGERLDVAQGEAQPSAVVVNELAGIKTQLAILWDELSQMDSLQSGSRTELDARINQIVALLRTSRPK